MCHQPISSERSRTFKSANLNSKSEIQIRGIAFRLAYLPGQRLGLSKRCSSGLGKNGDEKTRERTTGSNALLKMLHVRQRTCWEKNGSRRRGSRRGGAPAAEWYRGGSKVLVGLYAENDVLVGAAARLLAQQQPPGQAGRLARHGHVVRSPRLAVFVSHAHARAAGAVPDALLGPEKETE